MRNRRLLVSVLAAVLALSFAVVPAALAQTQSLYWQRFDVDIAVQTNGDLRVQETQVINFTSGVFHQGFAYISTTNTDGITDVTVSENGKPYSLTGSSDAMSNGQYAVEPGDSGVVNVTWQMGTTENQTRTFVLAYTAHGVIRRYPQGNEFQWNAISPDQHYEIRESTVTLHMPPGAPLSNADYLVPPEFEGVPMTVSVAADKLSATWVATSETIAPKQGIQIVAQFAPNSIGGSAPTWQATFDQQNAWNTNVKPWLDLALATLALLILLGGPAAIYLLWYLRGRDPNIDAVPEYVTEPPQGLPPGIAGTLVDEKADVQDIIATLMDLARRGYLAIEESSESNAFRLVTKEYSLRQTLDGKRMEDLADFERQLYNAVFQNRTSVKMADLNQRFYTNIPTLETALYDSSVKMGYFAASPASVRSHYTMVGVLLLVGAIVGGLVLTVAFAAQTSTLLCPFMAAALVSIILMWVGRHMPVRSRKGAEAAALSKAFKNYLTNLEKYAKPDQVTDQFDKYLPFAIAFGLERTWINRFSQIPTTPMPGWYYPVGRPFIVGPLGMGTVAGAGQRPVPAATGLGGAAAGAPSLQGMSTGLSGGLQSMSNGLNTMLNSAARTLTSTPPASNTSGGGRSFSGGGGGGFSGGGGSGGGGRGFR